MAGSRKPGPLGLQHEVKDLADGTLSRRGSGRPGPIGSPAGFSGHATATMVEATATYLSATKPPTAATVPRKRVTIPVLREGSRGPEVEKLQSLLNSRFTPGPGLDVDGIFGPLTREAAVQFQRAKAIAIDGVVGKETWFQLLSSEPGSVRQPMRVAAPSPPGATSVSRAAGVPTAKPAAPAPPPAFAKAPVYEAKPAAPAPPPASAKVPVYEWSLEDKFAEALKRTAPKLPGEMRHQFEALLTPASLAVMAGALAVWAGAQFFGVGEIADIVLLLAGVYFLGSAIFTVAEDFYDFVSITIGAESEADLDSAATHLARVIAVIGVTAFLALLFKLRMKEGGGKGKAPTQSESAPPKTAKPAADAKSKGEPPAIKEVLSPEAQQIAKGHAWSKHKGEFPEFSTEEEFARHIDQIMKKPSSAKKLAKGREAFRDDKSKTVVIKDPGNPDGGTAFKPKAGEQYFDNLK